MLFLFQDSTPLDLFEDLRPSSLDFLDDSIDHFSYEPRRLGHLSPFQFFDQVPQSNRGQHQERTLIIGDDQFPAPALVFHFPELRKAAFFADARLQQVHLIELLLRDRHSPGWLCVFSWASIGLAPRAGPRPQPRQLLHITGSTPLAGHPLPTTPGLQVGQIDDDLPARTFLVMWGPTSDVPAHRLDRHPHRLGRGHHIHR